MTRSARGRRLSLSASVLVLVTAPGVGAAGAASLTSPRVGPITVRLGKPVRECGPHGNDCGPWPDLPVAVTFIARENLAPGLSWYEFNLRFTPTGPCPVDQGGMGGPATPSHLHAGRLATWANDIIDCPRIVHGAIVYDTNTAPHSHQYVPGVGAIDGVLVGTFTFSMK